MPFAFKNGITKAIKSTNKTKNINGCLNIVKIVAALSPFCLKSVFIILNRDENKVSTKPVAKTKNSIGMIIFIEFMKLFKNY